MKKILKNLSAFTVILVLTLSVCILPASAANATIAYSSSSPKVGESFTVSVTLNPGQSMYGAQYQLKYNSSILEYKSSSLGGGANGGAGIITAAPAIAGESKVTHTFTFSAIAAGSGTISVSGAVYGVNDDITVSASAAVTVSDASKSGNADLKALSLSNGTLSPKFSASRTSYTATVSNSVTECRVYATAADSAAKVSVGGSNTLSVGKNTRTVTVTAANGATKTYTVVITRQAASASSENSSAESSSSDNSSAVSSDNSSSGNSSANNSSSNTTSEIKDPDSPVISSENPYEAVLNGGTLSIATDLSAVSIPNGFTSKTVQLNGAAVAAAEDAGGNYTIYYLKSAADNEYTPYLLNSDGKSFKKLIYAVFGANTYIIAELPDMSRVEEEYYETNVDIGDFNVKAYASETPEMEDFYYLYCFFDGNFGMYRYDSREQVLQRSPEFKLTDSASEENAGLIARFSLLSLNGKIILISLCIAVLGALALIILLIVKVFGNRKSVFDEGYDISDGRFDSIEINDESSDK